MALVDPNIAMSYRGVELQDPLAQYGKVAAIQGAQQQNRLAQMQMQKGEREQEDLNRLRMLDPSAPGYIENVTRINPQLGSELSLRRQQQTTAERQATSADAEIRGKNLSYWQAKARDASRAPTDDALRALKLEGVALGLTDEATAESTFQQMLAMPPEKRAQMLLQSGAAAAAADPAEIASMRQLGFPLTPAGYESYRTSQRQERMLSPEEEAQRLRIAAAGRAPAQPREPSAPIAIVDEATGTIKYVSREQAMGRTPASAQTEGITPKEVQKRNAAYPQQTQAIKSVEANTDNFIADLQKLANHPGLSGITGLIAGRTPNLTGDARAAQALYDKIVAKGGFSVLQAMRDASKTGGALGNLSNQEGTQLKSAFAAINQTQDTGTVKANLLDVINQLNSSKARLRETYESTYDYKNAATPTPSRGGASGSFDAPAADPLGIRK